LAAKYITVVDGMTLIRNPPLPVSCSSVERYGLLSVKDYLEKAKTLKAYSGPLLGRRLFD
jgi:hypothetical protein